MARLARDRGYPVQLVAGTNMGTEEFGLIAGPAAEGTIFTDHADPRGRAEAAPVVERFRASGFEPEGDTLYAYAAVQAWAQAAEKAGSLELQAMIAALRDHQFDTVLGPIDFDEKGDLTVQSPAWYVWRGGAYMPLEQTEAEGVNECRSSPRRRKRHWRGRYCHAPLGHRSRRHVAAALGGPARADVLIGLAGPMTGKDAWFGEQMERGAELAVADVNAAGGVLGQQVQLITADDFCDPEQAVAAARKLVSDGVIFVVGHHCSGASIPASEIYEAAGVLMISPTSTNPMLTELGRANVFRVQSPRRCGRCRGRQLPGRSLVRQEDRDPARQHDLWEGYRRVDKEAVESSWPDGSDLPCLCPREDQLWSRNR